MDSYSNGGDSGVGAVMDKPVIPIQNDGIYTRCVWCNGENYAPNVIAYSKAESACHQCGKFVPEEYVL